MESRPLLSEEEQAKQRMRMNSALFLSLFVCVIAMLFLEAPIWATICTAIVGCYVALRDHRLVRERAKRLFASDPKD
jgi:energy-coupling factor transporter transmembrane protein EcfT